jgi:hypothetical protein
MVRVSNPVTSERFFPSPKRPDRLWGPHNLVINWYRDSFSEIGWLGREVQPLTTMWRRVSEWVEPYLCSPCMRLCCVQWQRYLYTLVLYITIAWQLQKQIYSFTESMKYVLDIQSELNYIIKKWNTKYQLHVSAIMLAIIKLYLTL